MQWDVRDVINGQPPRFAAARLNKLEQATRIDRVAPTLPDDPVPQVSRRVVQTQPLEQVPEQRTEPLAPALASAAAAVPASPGALAALETAPTAPDSLAFSGPQSMPMPHSQAPHSTTAPLSTPMLAAGARGTAPTSTPRQHRSKAPWILLGGAVLFFLASAAVAFVMIMPRLASTGNDEGLNAEPEASAPVPMGEPNSEAAGIQPAPTDAAQQPAKDSNSDSALKSRAPKATKTIAAKPGTRSDDTRDEPPDSAAQREPQTSNESNESNESDAVDGNDDPDEADRAQPADEADSGDEKTTNSDPETPPAPEAEKKKRKKKERGPKLGRKK
jgi:hypothetical protein